MLCPPFSLNYVWPNIFETSPHVINAVMEAIEGMRVALGAAVILNYCLQSFHPLELKMHWWLPIRLRMVLSVIELSQGFYTFQFLN
ncbi:hypothetical protein Leryth_006145 [Lithospermum erythrorhizon]|nr:hypothetical protein Leryth_006145 [Lithospermum erythrorhizon]